MCVCVREREKKRKREREIVATCGAMRGRPAFSKKGAAKRASCSASAGSIAPLVNRADETGVDVQRITVQSTARSALQDGVVVLF